MSDTPTPRTDAVAEPTWQEGEVVLADFARQLERELVEAKTSRDHALHNNSVLLDQRDQLRAEMERLKQELVVMGEWRDQWREVATLLRDSINEGRPGYSQQANALAAYERLAKGDKP